MMEVTGKLIEGIIHLTKLLAHGAMHEACLIEVIRTIEDEAFTLLKRVKSCTYGNQTVDEVENYIRQNNATVLDVVGSDLKDNIPKHNTANEGVKEMTELIRRMLTDSKGHELDKKFKNKLKKMENDLLAIDQNRIAGEHKKLD